MKRGGWFVARGGEEVVMVAEAVSRRVEQSDVWRLVDRCGSGVSAGGNTCAYRGMEEDDRSRTAAACR